MLNINLEIFIKQVKVEVRNEFLKIYWAGLDLRCIK